MNKENSNVEEVKWGNVSEDKFGNIKFCKKKNNTKRVFKVIIFIIIAASAGALSSKVIVEKEFSQILQGKNVKSKNYNLVQDNSQKLVSGIAKTVEKVGPSIVGIIRGDTPSYASSGSGVIFSHDGYIVTNSHIIKDWNKIKVKLPNSHKYIEAKLIGEDDNLDIAIIKIDAKRLPVAKFGDSSEVNVGDTAIAIGNPLGEPFPGNVSCGIISGFQESKFKDNTALKTFKTDACINVTNSGGVLCNNSGEVIGVNSTELNHEKIEGIGFSVYSNEVKDIVHDIIKYGKCTKFNIGINGKKVVSGRDKKIKGVYVNEVIKGSPAESAGIKPTDIVIELDDKGIKSFRDIDIVLEKHKLGDYIKCTVWRNEKIIKLTINLSFLKGNN